MSTQASTSRASPPPAAPSLLPRLRLTGLKGMQTLDSEQFVTRIPIISVRVEPGSIAELKHHPMLQGQLLDVRRVASVLPVPGSNDKLLRLRVESEERLPAVVREFLSTRSKGYEKDVVELKYDYWSASEVLNAILPNVTEEEAPSSFTQTGHIGHVNLRDEWLPYKHLIGRVLLDKNPQMRTIVNKLNTIHAQYRYFDMEVLAGDPDFVATVNEGNCSFTLDFQTVYWNSRLHREHDRLVSLFRPGEVVADVMAGVGPFAVPAAKKGCRVLGNDLNPEGVKWMAINRINNKVEDTLRVTEMDGREFIPYAPGAVWKNPFPPVVLPLSRKQKDRTARLARSSKSDPTAAPPSPSSVAPADPAAPADPTTPPSTERQEIDHFVMNLPDSALTFLDAFRGSYNGLAKEAGYDTAKGKMPMVHVYCFTREMERPGAEQDIQKRAEEYLGHPLKSTMPDYNLHLVRSVAPNKDMYCLSFRLPREVAFASKVEVQA